VSSNFFVSAGVGHSWPRKGLDSLAPNLKPWTGAYLNLLVQY
jgi:hypothetical protein